MIQEFTSSVFYSSWPFWLLSVTPTATAEDVSKAARQLDAKLTLGVEEAKYFMTPLGLRERDQFSVREAKAVLEDPQQRLLAEFWYTPLKTDITPESNGQLDEEQAVKEPAVGTSNSMSSSIEWIEELKLP